MAKLSENNTRVNVILDSETMEMIDEYGKQLGLNRSASIRFMCRQFLQGQKAMQSFADIVEAIKTEQAKQMIETPLLRSPKK